MNTKEQYELYAYPKHSARNGVRLLCFAHTNLDTVKAKLPEMKEMLVANFRIQFSIYNEKNYRIFEKTIDLP